jgi:hypothetical protein
MKQKTVLLWACALSALCSAVVLLACNFQFVPVTASDLERAVWASSSISWSLNPSLPSNNVFSAANTVANESALQGALASAFNTWSSATYNSSTMNTLAFSQGADNSNSTVNLADCVNSIGFTVTLATGVIAQTTNMYQFSTSAGFNYSCTSAPTTRNCPYKACISDADVEFNTSYNFSTYSGAPSGQFDLQSVATHEIGHMIGLDHSGIAHAVMFPYGDTNQIGSSHALWIDDEIGSASLYPNNAILPYLGEIKGAVSVGGANAFAVHVVAVDAASGNAITDTLTDPSGNYTLQVVEGNYYVVAVPLGTATSGSGANGTTTLMNYPGFACGYASNYSACTGYPTNPTDFTGTYY